ncbi:MAG: hypothetical protein ACKOX0_07030 [Bacteroidota bacterium]|jgi:hypothetical protein
MMLHAFSLAASAFRRHPYPFAATGAIALALNMLGMLAPALAMVSSLALLPMLYVGLGTLAEAEPGLRFTQALRLALSAWPRMLALASLMILLVLGLSIVLGASLSALYGDQLQLLVERYAERPEGLVEALRTQIDWSRSAYGLAALALFTLAGTTVFWLAPLALVYRNLGVLQSLIWSAKTGTSHFATLLPSVLLWAVLSLVSGALVGLNILIWPLTALFHFYCFQTLGKQGA